MLTRLLSAGIVCGTLLTSLADARRVTKEDDTFRQELTDDFRLIITIKKMPITVEEKKDEFLSYAVPGEPFQPVNEKSPGIMAQYFERFTELQYLVRTATIAYQETVAEQDKFIDKYLAQIQSAHEKQGDGYQLVERYRYSESKLPVYRLRYRVTIAARELEIYEQLVLTSMKMYQSTVMGPAENVQANATKVASLVELLHKQDPKGVLGFIKGGKGSKGKNLAAGDPDDPSKPATRVKPDWDTSPNEEDGNYSSPLDKLKEDQVIWLILLAATLLSTTLLLRRQRKRRR